MNRRIFKKFFLAYILIGILCFILALTLGSYLIERHLINLTSASLYVEANNIANDDIIKEGISSDNVHILTDTFTSLAQYQNSIIWLMNSNGEIVLSSLKDVDPEKPIKIQYFDPTEWGNSYYQVGNFYGCFSDKRLSILAPITHDMNIKGYVAINYEMELLYQRRSSALLIFMMLAGLFYLLFAFLLLIFWHYVDYPLTQITRGAAEYAQGNMTYRIPLKSDNELGYLSNTLNYMAERIHDHGEYQRTFLSNVSHDFRSPLTSIKGYIEAILDGTIPPELQDRYLKIVVFEVGRLEKLTQNLMTLNNLNVKKNSLHFSRFNINNMIKMTAESFEGTCTKRLIHLELLLHGHDLFVSADPEKIQQVLYNLLDNAIKFSPDASTITIETTEKNGKVFVSVKDRGTGISKENIPKIWTRFFKADSSSGKDRQGTGLGLSIVKEIINAHDQQIDVISTENVGTEFIFTLNSVK